MRESPATRKRRPHCSFFSFFLFFSLLPLLPSGARASVEAGDLLPLGAYEPEGDIDALLEELDQLRRRRIPLNEASLDELLRLPWLDLSDAEALVQRRQRVGPITSVEELAEVIGSDKAERSAPYLVFGREFLLRRQALREAVGGSFYSRWYTELPERDGITTGDYPGPNYRLYNRLLVSLPHLDAAVVQEQDIGEPDLFDFTSLSLHLLDIGLLKGAVLGNYRVNFGQGLLVGQNRYFSKGSDPIGSLRLSPTRLSPFRSSSEYGYLQGAAATLSLQPFELTAFASSNRVDGRIDEGVITSFDTSGYHRTELEVERKDTVREEVEGGGLLWHWRSEGLSGHLGGNLLHYRYSEPLEALSVENEPRSSASLWSLEGSLRSGRFGFFGEAAFAEAPDAVSWIAGIECKLFEGVRAALSARRYGERYYSPFAGAFAERGDGGANEEGYYAAIEARLLSNLSLSGYYDRFRFPELSADNYPHASLGHDLRLFTLWKPSRPLELALQYQHKLKEEARLQDGDYAPLPVATDRLRLDCKLALSRRLVLKSRGEVKRAEQRWLAGNERFDGWLLYQQVNYTPGPFTLKGRLTRFLTEDYDAAIYAYEDDLPLVFSQGVYNGRGTSCFLLAGWKPVPAVHLAARYEITWYDDREVYGDGRDERPTSAPGALHLGAMLKF